MKKQKTREEELTFLKERLRIRQILFMEWAFVDDRLIKDIKEFAEETREIEDRIIKLKQKIKQEK